MQPFATVTKMTRPQIAPPRPDRKGPNVLWICTDSQRWDTLGAYGNPWVHTPNLDRLASEGMLFEHCYSQNPLCQPSRGSFLTGRYPSVTRLRQNGQNIPAGERLVTRVLADEGYICGLSGKLHLHACNRRNLLGEEWWKSGREEEVIQGQEPRIDDGYVEFHWDHAPSANFPSSDYCQWVRDQGAEIRNPPRSDSADVLQGMPEELHQTTWCVERAIRFIENYSKRNAPWLFSVNIFDPHYVMNPPEKYLARYLEKLDQIPLPNYVPGELNNKPEHQRKKHANSIYGGYRESDLGDPHEHRMNRAAYWAMCDLIDAQTGRLLDCLEKTGQRENTLVIFTSDHGEMLGDNGLYLKGAYLYDPAIRVPLIVSMPGKIAAGVRRKALVELSSLAPTLLDACDLPRHPGMQTKSLWPLLTDPNHPDQLESEVFCEFRNSNPGPTPFLSMIRDHEYKIIAWHGHETGELYNINQDPGEHRNLWHDPTSQEVKLTMLQRLADRMAFASTDPLPERIGIY